MLQGVVRDCMDVIAVEISELPQIFDLSYTTAAVPEFSHFQTPGNKKTEWILMLVAYNHQS